MGTVYKKVLLYDKELLFYRAIRTSIPARFLFHVAMRYCTATVTVQKDEVAASHSPHGRFGGGRQSIALDSCRAQRRHGTAPEEFQRGV